MRGVIEAQLLSMALHSRWMGIGFDAIHATGGASANGAILQVMADVFAATVYQFEVRNSAALGAALRARHAGALAAGHRETWDAIVRDVAAPSSARAIPPDRGRHDLYRAHLRVYAACEARALGLTPLA